MNDNENYSNHPQSVTELRAQRQRDGSEWTPRDALISMLRDIDSGRYQDCDAVVISLRHGNGYAFAQASQGQDTSLGLLERTKHMMINGKRDT